MTKVRFISVTSCHRMMFLTQLLKTQQEVKARGRETQAQVKNEGVRKKKGEDGLPVSES